jgi:hypothetical protein
METELYQGTKFNLISFHYYKSFCISTISELSTMHNSLYLMRVGIVYAQA